MPAKLPVQIVGQAYADETLSWAAQECINYYPVLAETPGTRSVAMLKGTPGLTSFGAVGTGTVRGMLEVGGVLYVVADTTLYSVDANGTETPLGTIEDSNRVGMTANRIAGGYQVVVVNGTKGWVYNTFTAAFAEITDADYSHSVDCVFIGQYIAHVEGDSDQWFISALGDATSYDAGDFASAETATDDLIGISALDRDVWLFGESVTEVWAETGAADFPFERRTVISKGIASTFAKANLDNSIYWLSNNGIVYRAEGYAARRISTGPLEQAIGDETLSEAFAFAYEDKGHAFFVLTFPSGKTWVYDVATNMWHRRRSFGKERWRANAYAFAYGKHLVGDTSGGTVWEIDATAYAEGSDPLVAERKTGYEHKDGEPFSVNEIEITFKGGVGLTTGQGSAPVVDLAYSKDGGRNFSDFRQASLGLIGQYARLARFFRFGQFKGSIMLHIRISDPVNRDILAASAR